jgi:hypothetical protein
LNLSKKNQGGWDDTDIWSASPLYRLLTSNFEGLNLYLKTLVYLSLYLFSRFD